MIPIVVASPGGPPSSTVVVVVVVLQSFQFVDNESVTPPGLGQDPLYDGPSVRDADNATIDLVRTYQMQYLCCKVMGRKQIVAVAPASVEDTIKVGVPKVQRSRNDWWQYLAHG